MDKLTCLLGTKQKPLLTAPKTQTSIQSTRREKIISSMADPNINSMLWMYDNDLGKHMYIHRLYEILEIIVVRMHLSHRYAVNIGRRCAYIHIIIRSQLVLTDGINAQKHRAQKIYLVFILRDPLVKFKTPKS